MYKIRVEAIRILLKLTRSPINSNRILIASIVIFRFAYISLKTLSYNLRYVSGFEPRILLLLPNICNVTSLIIRNVKPEKNHI